MGLVSTWLNGIGLSSAVPTFQAAGIVTPAALAELDVAHFEALGISDPDERRKLFYLVQRIKMAVNKDKPRQENSVEEQVDAVISGVVITTEEDPVEETTMSPKRRKSTKTKKAAETPASEPRRSHRLAKAKKKKKKDKTDNETEDSATKENQSKPAKPKKSKRRSTTDGLSSSPVQQGSPTKSTASASNGAAAKTAPTRKSPATNKTRKNKGPAAELEPLAKPNTVIGNGVPEEERQEENDFIVEEPKVLARRQSTTRRTKGVSKNVFNLQDDDKEESPPKSLPTRKLSGLKQPKSVSNAKVDEDAGGATLEPAVAPRRPESKLQNPGKSLRTGKKLAAIPSEKVAPMSPLVDIALAETRRPRESSQSREGSADSRGPTISESSFLAALDNADEDPDYEAESPIPSDPPRTYRARSKSIGTSDMPQTKARSLSRPKGRLSLGKADVGGNRRMSEGVLKASTGSKSGAVNRSVNKSTPFVQGGVKAESWATKVEYLREDNTADHEMFQGQEDQQIYEYDMRIRVIVRKRPLSKAEANLSGGVDVIHPLDYGDYGRVLVYQPKTRVDLTKEIETIPFSFDNVYGESSTNIQIYQRSLKNLIQPFFLGQWSTVFAYGQTGSGKTYTMMGSNMTGVNSGTATVDEANFGLYYLAALDIFKMAEKPEYQHLTVQVSLFEIYGGKLFDLLNTRRQVKCLEDSKGKVCFPGLTEHPVDGPDALMALIEEGSTNRSTGTTSRNADSSRSHAVLQLKLRKDVGRRKNVEHGRLNFIDLAGSERGADTSSASRATRLEGAEINTSLLALKEVIRALATGRSMTHIPFRGSKLTQVLKDSFVGENSRCCMVACVSPDIASCEQTINTLRYADRVKERDPDSGALANGYEEPVRLNPLSTTLSEDVDVIVSDDEVENDLGRGSSLDEYDDSDNGDVGFEPPTDQAMLDRLLSSSFDHPPPAAGEIEPQGPSGTKHEAGQHLVTSHRAAMSEMFAMLKDEMTLVNAVDADRDLLDGYLVQLEEWQSSQLDLITNLRDSLNRYVTACEAPDAPTSPGVESDDESFEDLRD